MKLVDFKTEAIRDYGKITQKMSSYLYVHIRSLMMVVVVTKMALETSVQYRHLT
jgi:hypothetical protein